LGGYHAETFKEHLGKTHFFGRSMKDGDIWQAYGTPVSIQFAVFFDLKLRSSDQ